MREERQRGHDFFLMIFFSYFISISLEAMLLYVRTSWKTMNATGEDLTDGFFCSAVPPNFSGAIKSTIISICMFPSSITFFFLLCFGVFCVFL
jgi:hypothetical protein